MRVGHQIRVKSTKLFYISVPLSMRSEPENTSLKKDRRMYFNTIVCTKVIYIYVSVPPSIRSEPEDGDYTVKKDRRLYYSAMVCTRVLNSLLFQYRQVYARSRKAASTQ